MAYIVAIAIKSLLTSLGSNNDLGLISKIFLGCGPKLPKVRGVTETLCTKENTQWIMQFLVNLFKNFN